MIQEKDLKIGMKVKIPKTKSVLGKIEDSNVIKRAIENKQDYLFYTGNEYINWYKLNDKNYSSGDFFALEDLELYEEPFILPEKWKVKVTPENAEKLTIWKIKVSKGYFTSNANRYDWIIQDGSGDNSDSTGNNKFQEITWEKFQQHILKEETKLEETINLPTENFGIQVVNGNGADIVEWFKSNNFKCQYVGDGYEGDIYYVKEDKKVYYNCPLLPIKIYTLEEIKQLEQSKSDTMQLQATLLTKKSTEKEIIGYKLIKPELEDAVKNITKYTNWDYVNCKDASGNTYYAVQEDTECYHKLKEAGVLDLWFTPVYKQEEKKYRVGDWVLTSNNADGWGSYKEQVCGRILKITSIDLEDRKEYGGRFTFKNYRTVGKEIVRKATEEEIEAATCKTVKLSIGKNVDIERDKLSNQVYILAEGKQIQYKHINNLYCNTNTFGDTGWTIQYNTFDIGCWKNVTRADLRLILDAYEEINAKLE